MSFHQEMLPPSHEELLGIYKMKYYRAGEPGWSPKLRLRFDYFSPDDHYEALVARLVTGGCSWADVGCGRDIFPHNPALALELSQRCGYLLGIDPSDNVKDNPFITESFQGMVEDCKPSRQFDLVTMRMVAEHIVAPEKSVRRIAQMLKPGGVAVIYTPYKWAVMSVLAAASPSWLHHPIKRVLWGGEERDTFPTAYKLNTRAAFDYHFGNNGMRALLFQHLDDCRILGRFRATSYLELSLQKLHRHIRVRYPETCILTVYQSPVR